MRVRELIEESGPRPGLRLLATPDGLNREFATVTVTDLPDPGRYLRGGELVLTGMMWLSRAAGGPVVSRCEAFVAAVAERRCAALAAGDTTDDSLPAELIDACTRYELPLLHVPASLAFSALTDWISTRVAADEALRRAGHDLVALAASAGPTAIRETLAEVHRAVQPPLPEAHPESHLDLLAALPTPVRQHYRDHLLTPVRAYDAQHHTHLEETLETFLSQSASWSRSAHHLHIHVNTLRYRISKITELTGRDPTRLDHLVDLHLALHAG